MCSCALLFAYVVWFVVFKPALRIEGKERISIADFGNGATVTHAFVMPVDGLHGVSVKISVDRPSTLTFSYKLMQLSDTSPGGENRLDAYAEIHRWSDRLTVRSGERWHRVTFPSVAASKDGWYAFEIRLLDASPAGGPTTADTWPAVSIAASQDNPARGGKLWIDGVRQPGSLFLLAHVRSDGIQIALLLAYLWTLAALIYVTFFAGGRAHNALLRLLRSVLLPQAVTVIALVIGLPLFLRSPLWTDLTLYDVAARNLLWGGVHYRDVFDTNLPGFVWIMVLIRGALGFDPLALRLVDLAIVTGIVLLIDRIAKLGGASPVARWWAIAGAAVLYPSTVEMAHAQRDTWMALPAAAAVLLRLRRLNRTGVSRGRVFRDSALEGALWGVAVWIKPHCLLMAAGVWLFSVWRVANTAERRFAGFAADLLGNLACGLALAVLGIGGIALSGGWPYFWDILTVWAPEYARLARREFAGRYHQELHWFPPWSLWLIPTVPLAMLSILDAPFWSSAHDGEPRPGPVGRILPRWLWVHAAESGGALRPRRAGRALPRLGRAVLRGPARLRVRAPGRALPDVRPLGGTPLVDAGGGDHVAGPDQHGVACRRRGPPSAHQPLPDCRARQPAGLGTGQGTLFRPPSAGRSRALADLAGLLAREHDRTGALCLVGAVAAS